MAKKKEGATGVKKIDGNLKIELKSKADGKFSMMDDIKSSPLYGKTGRDGPARDFIKENAEPTNGNSIVPGQLIMFDYFEPATKEELEYYDAGPCTIFFNVFNTSKGQRVLGFNIHYYPPKMRYQIMNRIFEIYRPVYRKYFSEPQTKEFDAFDYETLISELNRANLGFGVRMYIPELMANLRIVPANMWKVAVFTEGWFKKMNRATIMKFWEKWLKGTKDSGKATTKGYKTGKGSRTRKK